MKRWFIHKSVEVQTLIVFASSVVIAIPLMLLLVSITENEYLRYAEVSALGWTAGGAIVGTYVLGKARLR